MESPPSSDALLLGDYSSKVFFKADHGSRLHPYEVAR